MSISTDISHIDLTPLSSPPFITIGGIWNVRDIGGYKSTTHPGHIVRTHRVLRAGEPTFVNAAGKQALKDYGVTAMFDLRSSVELARSSKEIPPPEIEGVAFIANGAPEPEDYTPERVLKFLKDLEENEMKTYVDLYIDYIVQFSKPYENVLRWLKDHPSQGCLVNCTAGKDRTGVFIALLFSILGVSDEDIAQEFSLSQLGLVPAYETLSTRMKGVKLFADHPTGTARMGNATKEVMLEFLKQVRNKWGGIDGYLKENTTLTEDELEEIRGSVLVKDETAA